ncbi:MAG: hydroxyacid dehydrogenase [Rhizobiaceae bacterium]|nr:hydroxyacid dehydrogenase [Rhizobiaceae bacterium]MCV0408199.1 hydroxyacid dehydrogenase [Rhizobiaceae bacterium]
MNADLPLVLFDPHPRRREMLFDEAMWARLAALARIVAHDGEGRIPDTVLDRHIGEAALVIGQTDLPSDRLAHAAKLRAVINVEGNFLPNVDYAGCFARGIQVLTIAPAFALPVAEMALALALDLARGVTAADRAFREGREKFGLSGNDGTYLLTDSTIGMIGFGNLGRALLPLLQPFRPRVKVYDPWLPDGYLRDFGVVPAPLDEVLSTSQTVFVLAGVTTDNQAMIGARELALLADGAAIVLISRAGVVDWQAFTAAVASGRIRAATDVFPVEPVAADDPVRENLNLLLSAHRAGGMRPIFRKIGEMVIDDAELILKGLPPVRLQAARAETVGRMRSMPGREYTKEETR